MSAVLSYQSPTTCAAGTRVYRRRHPEYTALYRLVQRHLDTWLAHRRERDADGAPPALETDGAGTAAVAFDQSPSWDPAAAPPDPGFSFDQTLN